LSISKAIFLILGLLATGSLSSNAYAYIDPGSGSAIITMIIGALVGVGMTAKLYWVRIKEKFSKN